MQILMIGNSYTYFNQMPALLEALCRENGKDVTVTSVTKGGRRLIAYQQEDPTTLALREALKDGRYEVCFIQEQSVAPALRPEEFLEGLRHVESMTRPFVDRYILYSTWGRKEGNSVLQDHGWTNREMARLLSLSYQKAAELLGADRSPVGEAFLWMKKHYPQTELYVEDGSHPSYEGSCLGTMVHYRTLFGTLPEKIDTLGLSPLLAEQFYGALSSHEDVFASEE